MQELFAFEIAPIDPLFFIRIAESALYPSDKEEPNAIFNDAGYTDADYHRHYPTIHHLIHELMTSDEPHDVRLVYLACAWLVTHRGHFLSQIGGNSVEDVMDFTTVYDLFRDHLIDQEYTIPWPETSRSQIEAALRMRSDVRHKREALCKACFPRGKVPKGHVDGFPLNCQKLMHALAGGEINAKDLFNNPEYAEIEKFSLASEEEVLASIIGRLGDEGTLIQDMKALYDWSLMADVLGGSNTLSEAKIAAYRQHEVDLAFLKHIVRKYCPGQFNAMFRDPAIADNYVAYSYHGVDENTKKRCTQEDFCKYVRKTVKDIKPDVNDKTSFEDMLARLESNRFMPKQRTGDNRVIPYQLYLSELNCLLMRAERYLPFLATPDADGLTVSDKIRSIFAFRVPYYVGPLGRNGGKKHQWAVRRQDGRILPWNFEHKIDLDASENAFIRNMTNTCTYLPSEDVLPKESLLYHRFTVLNEINNLKVNGTPISVEQKQAIYNDVFLNHVKVTLKRLKDYMCANGIMCPSDELSGIDETIKSNLKPWHDYHLLMERGVLTQEDVERIIERRTYSEELPRFLKWLKEEFPGLPETDVRHISRLRYKDFGRLSRRFLTELEGVNLRTGECTTIMQALWETNDNLMELLSDRYTFSHTVDEVRQEYYQEHASTTPERLEEMYIPTAVRRPVLRALDITGEVVKAFKHAPECIFVEMSRGGLPEQRGRRTQSRRNQLLALYEQCQDEDVGELRAQLENMGNTADARLQSEKLFLYYLQLGRCLYTGNPIDLNSLFNDNIYNVDHIYPQSLVKDESILNNKALVTSEENSRKGNGMVPADVRQNMLAWWEHLKKEGLINDEKFHRLTRSTSFSQDEKWGFINRQLTETTQASKAVTELLQEIYPESKIVFVKAQLAVDFRQAFQRIKSRDYNDLHHAKDAYLNIVVGNVWHEKFTKSWFLKGQSYNLKPEELYTRPVVNGQMTIWDGIPMLEKVKTVLLKNNAHMTCYSYQRKGGLFAQQPVKKGSGLIPRKQGLDPEKYGGYNKAAISFFVLAKFSTAQKTDVMFMPVELLIANRYLTDSAFREAYALKKITTILGKVIQTVSFPLGERILKINTVLSIDGYRACITGNSSFGKEILLSGQTPFAASYREERYLKRLRSLCDKLSDNSRYAFSAEADKVTAEENLRLYDLYTQKLKNTIYGKRPNHPLQTLIEGRAKFLELSPIVQVRVLLSIHAVFGRLSGGTDLQEIGGAKNAAVSKRNTCLSNWCKINQDVRIVDQSASGLWEARSKNLLELL